MIFDDPTGHVISRLSSAWQIHDDYKALFNTPEARLRNDLFSRIPGESKYECILQLGEKQYTQKITGNNTQSLLIEPLNLVLHHYS